MPERRRYTKRQKGVVVAIAEMSSVAAAAEKSGVPESTVRYWRDSPEFAEIRAKTKADLAEGWIVVAHLAVDSMIGALQRGEFKPQDLPTLGGIATDKSQLLSGAATERAETRDLTNDDHERAALRDAIKREIAERHTDAEAAPGVEVPAVADAGP